MSDSFATPWTVACQAPLSMGFPRQEYLSGLLFLFQGIFQIHGLNPHLLHCRQILYYWAIGEVLMNICIVKMIRPALTDFSWLTIHFSSWLGLITKLLLLMVPNVSNGELSEGCSLVHEGKKEVLGEGKRVSYPLCMVLPLPLFFRNRNSKNKNIFNFTSVSVIIPR